MSTFHQTVRTEMLLLALLIGLTGIAETHGVDPCDTDRYIPDLYDRIAGDDLWRPDYYSYYYHNYYNDYDGNCDSFNSTYWYRADLKYASFYDWEPYNSVSADILTEPPEPGNDESWFRVWMNGSIPGMLDGVVSRTACVTNLTDTCEENFEIQVKNCGEYRVYNLPHVPWCPMVYSFGLTVETETTQWDPCNATRVLNNLTMRATSVQAEQGFNLTDDELVPDWYRVDGYDMPLYPPDNGSCSTQHPIWLNGNIPDVSEGIVLRTVCSDLPSIDSLYYFRSSVRIKNCGEYRVYYLLPFLHWIYEPAYCFDPTSVQDTTNGYLCNNTHASTEIELRSLADVVEQLDNLEQNVWYIADGIDVPRGPPAQEQCDKKIWMYGTIPDISEGVVYRALYAGCSLCNGSHVGTVGVKNCGDTCFYRFYMHLDIMSNYSLVEQENETIEPCDAVETLENIDQRHTTNTFDRNMYYYDYHGEHSDKYLLEQWYRMDGVDMPTFPPTRRSCGTAAPMWMTGSVPKVSEGIVTRTTCRMSSPWNGGMCNSPQEIKVKNCGHYRVYKLKPPCSSYASYCFDPSPESYNDQGMFDPNVTVEILDATDQSTDLVFECRFETDNEHLYNVSWYGDDVLLKKTESLTSQTIRQHHLHQDDIPELDITILCVVESQSLAGNVILNSSRISRGRYIGIDIETPVLNIPRGDTNFHQVTMKSTIPIRCSNSFTGGSCALTIHQKEDVSEACRDWDVTFNNRCQMRVGNTESAEIMTFDVSVRSQITTKDIDTTRILQLQVSSNDLTINRIWKGYSLKDIRVRVYDASRSWKNKECYANADPHMRNFDGRGFELQMAGTFILYIHDDLPLEVQMTTMLCYPEWINPWWDGPYCVCAVAVRAGGDVFLYSVCEQPVFIGKTKCDDDILDVKEISADGSYKIFLPTGMIVNIYPLWRNILNVKITASPKDFGKTHGICGILSNDRTDDFMLRDSIVTDDNTYEPNDFSLSWSVRPEENLFDPDVEVSGAWEQNITMCVCPFSDTERGDSPQQTGAVTDCSQKMYNTCDLDELIETKESKFKCTIVPYDQHIRRRREVVRRLKHAKSRQRRSTEGGGNNGNWTGNAEEHCRSAFENHPAYPDCINTTDVNVTNSIENCISDINMTHNTAFTGMAVDLFVRSCLIQLENKGKPTGNDSSEISSEMKQRIKKAFCPNECNGNGHCVEGICVCNPGFALGDCSIDLLAPPTPYDITNGGVCDPDIMDCSEMNIFGGDFFESENLTCRIRSQTTKPTGESNDVITSDVAAQRVSRYEVSFTYPDVTDEHIASVSNISVSNTGDAFGEDIEMVVYNHRHVIHTTTGGSHAFTLKGTSCFIDGQFYDDDEVNADDASLSCDTNLSQYTWTKEVADNSSPCLRINFAVFLIQVAITTAVKHVIAVLTE